MEAKTGHNGQPEKPNGFVHKWFAFSITFLAVALVHANRKSFSNVKSTMASTWCPHNVEDIDLYDYSQWNKNHLFSSKEGATYFLGTLDSIFMIAYSIGMFVSGIVCDRYCLRKVLAVGVLISSFTMVLFGCVSEWYQIYNWYWYAVFWFITGLFQAIVWPAVLAIVGNWFGKGHRGFIMALWGACTSVGNMWGSYLSSNLLSYGYEVSFLVHGSVTVFIACCVFFGLVASPKEIGLVPVYKDSIIADENTNLLDSTGDSSRIKDNDSTRRGKPKAINFFSAFLLPGVLAYALAYGCLKIVNYSFFFWLPFYLQDVYQWFEADSAFLSMFYDIGGIVGGIIGGLLSDVMHIRSPVLGAMLLLGIPSIYGYYICPPDRTTNAILMSVLGFFISGVSTLIATAVTTDLGKQKVLRNNAEAMATVAGIVDGTGSSGAAIGQFIIPYLKGKKEGDWFTIFLMFMIMTFLTLIIVSNIIYKDFKQIFQSRIHKRSEQSYSKI